MRILLIVLLLSGGMLLTTTPSSKDAVAWSTASQSVIEISRRDDFEEIVDGKRLKRLGIELTVHADGSITGSAFGRKVGGRWNWEDTFFCREMSYGSQTIPLDCQRVTLEGRKITFQAERGTGNRASLTIKD